MRYGCFSDSYGGQASSGCKLHAESIIPALVGMSHEAPSGISVVCFLKLWFGLFILLQRTQYKGLGGRKRTRHFHAEVSHRISLRSLQLLLESIQALLRIYVAGPYKLTFFGSRFDPCCMCPLVWWIAGFCCLIN